MLSSKLGEKYQLGTEIQVVAGRFRRAWEMSRFHTGPTTRQPINLDGLPWLVGQPTGGNRLTISVKRPNKYTSNHAWLIAYSLVVIDVAHAVLAIRRNINVKKDLAFRAVATAASTALQSSAFSEGALASAYAATKTTVTLQSHESAAKLIQQVSTP